MADVVSDSSCARAADDPGRLHQLRPAEEADSGDVSAAVADERKEAVGEDAKPGSAGSPGTHPSVSNDVHKGSAESEVTRSQDGECEGPGPEAAGLL